MEVITQPHPTRTASLLFQEVHTLTQPIDCNRFSFFSKPVTNTIPNSILNPQQAYALIVGEKYAAPTRLLRQITDKEQARRFKAYNFDYACFSGVFSYRSEKGLITHSGFLTIDIDHQKNAPSLKKELISNPYFETVLAFISPSGDGLKWIVKIDLEQYSHLQWFFSISSYLKKYYYIDIDQSGKDVSRCCFLCHDPQAYLNPLYQ